MTKKEIAHRLTKEIEAKIKLNQKDEFSPINEYDIIEEYILKVLNSEYPDA